MQWDKIIFTGPESSGKTTLAGVVSKQLSLPLVEEYARTYLITIPQKYTLEDVLHIAYKQAEEFNLIQTVVPVIYDTDLLTSIIWLKDKFNYIVPELEKLWAKPHNSVYFLCKPDFNWEFDPLREDAERRDILYQLHRNYLSDAGKIFYEIGGSIDSRLQQVLTILQRGK